MKLTEKNIRERLERLRGWRVVDHHHLSKSYTFADFKTAFAFVEKVKDIAEVLGHHPDVLLRWGEVRLDIWTHTMDGLTERDFILAAKCDDIAP